MKQMPVYATTIAFIKKERIIFFFFAVYVLVHIVLSNTTNLLSSHGGDYEITLRNLLSGNGFILPGGDVANRYPPLFPLILASVFALAIFTAVPVQVLTSLLLISLTALTAFAIRKMVRLFTDSQRVSNTVLICYFLSPYTLYLTFAPLSEVPFTFFFYLSLLFFSRFSVNFGVRDIIGLGLSIAACMLIRPVALFFVPVFMVLMLMMSLPVKTKISSGLLLLSVVGLLVAPWELFNFSLTGKVLPLSSGGVPSVRDGLSFNHKGFREKISMNRHAEEFSDSFYARYGSMQTLGDISAFIRESLKYNRGGVVGIYWLKLKRSWYGTDSQNHRLENFNKLFISLLFLLFTTSLFFLSKDLASLRNLTLIFILYFWIMTTAVLSIVRYMTPVFPLMYICLALGLEGAWQKYFRKAVIR